MPFRWAPKQALAFDAGPRRREGMLTLPRIFTKSRMKMTPRRASKRLTRAVRIRSEPVIRAATRDDEEWPRRVGRLILSCLGIWPTPRPYLIMRGAVNILTA